jgi:hypothetical protein
MNPLLLESIFEVGKGIIERLFPDPEKKAAAELELLKMKESGDLARLSATTELANAQIGLNTAEVQSGSILGKWRGFLGWGLACSAVYQLMVFPFMVISALAHRSEMTMPGMRVATTQQRYDSAPVLTIELYRICRPGLESGREEWK